MSDSTAPAATPAAAPAGDPAAPVTPADLAVPGTGFTDPDAEVVADVETPAAEDKAADKPADKPAEKEAEKDAEGEKPEDLLKAAQDRIATAEKEAESLRKKVEALEAEKIENYKNGLAKEKGLSAEALAFVTASDERGIAEQIGKLSALLGSKNSADIVADNVSTPESPVVGRNVVPTAGTYGEAHLDEDAAFNIGLRALRRRG